MTLSGRVHVTHAQWSALAVVPQQRTLKGKAESLRPTVCWKLDTLAGPLATAQRLTQLVAARAAQQTAQTPLRHYAKLVAECMAETGPHVQSLLDVAQILHILLAILDGPKQIANLATVL